MTTKLNLCGHRRVSRRAFGNLVGRPRGQHRARDRPAFGRFLPSPSLSHLVAANTKANSLAPYVPDPGTGTVKELLDAVGTGSSCDVLGRDPQDRGFFYTLEPRHC